MTGRQSMEAFDASAAPSRRLAGLLLAAFLCIAQAAEASASEWPDQTVTIEQLRAETPFRIQAPRPPAMGTVRGPATLRARVDSAGGVAEVRLMESCGNPSLDEAALRALQDMRFAPFVVDGVPVEVTLVLPVHIPKNLGRSRQGR